MYFEFRDALNTLAEEMDTDGNAQSHAYAVRLRAIIEEFDKID